MTTTLRGFRSEMPPQEVITDTRKQRLTPARRVGVVHLDRTGHCLFVNTIAASLMRRPANGLLGAEWPSLLHVADRQGVEGAIADVLETSVPVRLEHRVLGPDGHQRWVESLMAPSPTDLNEATHLVVLIEDISERKNTEAALVHQATHDDLTGLANRQQIHAHIDRALALRRSDEVVIVALVDLDRFKTVNDSLGHAIGDQVLAAVARRLEEIREPSETIGRVGGDEFLICRGPSKRDAAVVDLGDRIASALSLPMTVGATTIHQTGSVGIAITNEQAATSHALTHEADIAMYRAKAGGGGRAEIVDEHLSLDIARKAQLELDLGSAVGNSELVLHYQPIMSCGTNKIVGLEALVRWGHPSLGVLGPNEFIPLAERAGVISAITEHVLHEACTRTVEWAVEDNRMVDFTMSINVSATDLRNPDFAAIVAGALSSSGLDPARLRLEITESVLMDRTTEAITVLNRLRGLGVSIAIDDFGTGYSSLSYLADLPAQCLKVDGSFIAGLVGSGPRKASDPRAASIVSAIVNLAHSLGLSVVAEGVETSAQLASVYNLGCDLSQGYVHSRPLPPDDPNLRQLLIDPDRTLPALSRRELHLSLLRGRNESPLLPPETLRR